MKGILFSVPLLLTCLLTGWCGAQELQTADSVQVILFPQGYRVFTAPSSGAELKKDVVVPEEVNVAAWLDTPEGRFYLSDWSLDRRNKGESYFWVLPYGESGLAMDEEKAPRPQGIQELWNALWDEQTTAYTTLEFARELLPLLSEKEGPVAPRSLAVEFLLGVSEMELGQRAPGGMHVDNATGPLLELFVKLETDPNLFNEAGDGADSYPMSWVLTSRVAPDLAEMLLSRKRFDDVRRVVRAAPEGDPLRLPFFQLTLRLSEAQDPSSGESLELAGQLDEYDRESYLRLLDEKGYDAEAAAFARQWGLWSRSLRADPDALRLLLSRTEDDATKALILHCLGETSEALERWNKAIEETIWDIDLGLEHQDMYSGVPASFAMARELGVPESFLVPALERTVETMRRLANRVMAGGWSDMAETFLDVELPALAGSARYTADAALALKGCMLEREVFERRLNRYRGRADLASLILQLENLEKEYGTAFGDQTGNEAIGLQIEREMDRVLESLHVATGDGIFKVRTNRVTSQMVMASLPAAAALVEFVKYSRGYAAVVLFSDREPLFIDLARSDVIDPLVEELRATLVPPPNDTRSGETLEKNFQESSRRLYELVAAPIEAAIGSAVSDLVVSLDGDLHFLPLSALVAPDGLFWSETRKLTLVNSGRDLILRESPVVAVTHEAVLFGDPVFQLAPAGNHPAPAGTDADARSLRAGLRQGKCIEASTLASGITTLPGTREEVAGLLGILEGAGMTVTRFTQVEASEMNLYRVRSPRLLHLATHGFCLPGLITKKSGTAGTYLVTDPMQLSSLALSGACDAYAEWSSSGVTPFGEDGIILAQEIGAMELQGTELVTLSACETGLGLSTRNHGVQGLKTALLMAGAENLLLSLWPVSDEATVDFMESFYRRYASGQHPSQASHEAQLEMVANLRLAKASSRECAVLAAPFVLTCGRAPWH